MAKQIWKPGNMLYPLPAVMVSVADKEGNPNIITVAWAGTVCTNPPMVSISVRPERYSYHMIDETGEFVINLTTEKLVYATDYCGVRSGKDVDKFKELHLTPEKAEYVSAPLIAESPVNIECKDIEIPSDHPPDLFPEIRIPHHCCPQTALLVRRHIHKAHNLPDLHRIDPRCILLGKTADFFLFHTPVPQMLVADLDRRRAKACVVYLDIIDHCQIQERLIRNLL